MLVYICKKAYDKLLYNRKLQISINRDVKLCLVGDYHSLKEYLGI